MKSDSNISLIKDKYLWDFWYHYDKNETIFHVLYLNADKKFVEKNQHHFHANVGYATTSDFEFFDWISTNIFSVKNDAWNDISIWSGDLIKVNNLYFLFFTFRNLLEDKLIQHIGLAYSQNLLEWTRVNNFILSADSKFYENKTIIKEETIQAWRDPFLYMGYDNKLYMLIAAKSKSFPINKKGCIALLRAKNKSLLEWENLGPIYSPGFFSETELPQIYQDNDGGFRLFFNCWDRYDFSNNQEKGGLYELKIDSNEISINSKSIATSITKNLLGYYGFRLIPELGNVLAAFDVRTGRIRKFKINASYHLHERNLEGIHINF
ncbi:MAG: glycoside hydrolase family protein [Gammaproteobacteria bacterium]